MVLELHPHHKVGCVRSDLVLKNKNKMNKRLFSSFGNENIVFLKSLWQYAPSSGCNVKILFLYKHSFKSYVTITFLLVTTCNSRSQKSRK